MKKKIEEKAPPEWSKTVKKMKKHKEIENPFALSWWMKDKSYKPHNKKLKENFMELNELFEEVKSDFKGEPQVLLRKDFEHKDEFTNLARQLVDSYKQEGVGNASGLEEQEVEPKNINKDPEQGKPSSETGSKKPKEKIHPAKQEKPKTEKRGQVKRNKPKLTKFDNPFGEGYKLQRESISQNKTSKYQYDIWTKVEEGGKVLSFIVFWEVKEFPKNADKLKDPEWGDVEMDYVGQVGPFNFADKSTFTKTVEHFRWLAGRFLRQFEDPERI